jgi:hypothetical protein
MNPGLILDIEPDGKWTKQALKSIGLLSLPCFGEVAFIEIDEINVRQSVIGGKAVNVIPDCLRQGPGDEPAVR